MLLSDLVGMSVFDIAAAREVARVRTAVVDVVAHRVVGFRVSTDEPILALDDVEAVGPDSITIRGRDRLRHPSSDPEQRAVEGRIDPLGSRVLDDGGAEIGRVADVDFDPADGAITSVLVGHDHVEASELLGLGAYAMVVARRRS